MFVITLENVLGGTFRSDRSVSKSFHCPLGKKKKSFELLDIRFRGKGTAVLPNAT